MKKTDEPSSDEIVKRLRSFAKGMRDNNTPTSIKCRRCGFSILWSGQLLVTLPTFGKELPFCPVCISDFLEKAGIPRMEHEI